MAATFPSSFVHEAKDSTLFPVLLQSSYPTAHSEDVRKTVPWLRQGPLVTVRLGMRSAQTERHAKVSSSKQWLPSGASVNVQIFNQQVCKSGKSLYFYACMKRLDERTSGYLEYVASTTNAYMSNGPTCLATLRQFLTVSEQTVWDKQWVVQGGLGVWSITYII